MFHNNQTLINDFILQAESLWSVDCKIHWTEGCQHYLLGQKFREMNKREDFLLCLAKVNP